MRKCVAFIALLFTAFGANAQDLPTQHHDVVIDFINCFKKNDRTKLAGLVAYPLKREYPLPAINNKEEFLQRYDEVFDAKLVDMIVSSTLDKDWDAVGWRGIMLNRGDLWLDYDGTLIGVNYQSPAEAKKRTLLIEADRKLLHKSLKKFSEPVCVLSTENHTIRIDDIGQGKYRYTSWKKGNKMSERPDLVILNGEVFPDGSGGNHHYVFKNGNYTYECGIVRIGEEDSTPAYLTVYKKGKEVLNERAFLNEVIVP